MDINYKKFFSTKRLRDTTISRANSIEEFYSDRSRLIYSSSFRRLQQKAQVFSLESNSSVRTRMTHSLEVSDIGRSLSNRIAQKLYEQNYIDQSEIGMMVSIVENACLLHDIGNPPFGHFGEEAIKSWARNSFTDAGISRYKVQNKKLFKKLINDFLQFDGNPQGFRVITKLHTERDRFSLNLTYSTLLCSMKYVRAAGEPETQPNTKKAGYFLSEESLVTDIWKEVGMNAHTRYPFAYIMEAADDIAYCMSDISDGIEKGIITLQSFVNEFRSVWENSYGKRTCPIKKALSDSFNQEISIPWSKQIMQEATDQYMKHHEALYSGTHKELIPVDGTGRILKTMKEVSRKILYSSIQAESIEITGYAVITGILKHYEKILEMPHEDFKMLVYGGGLTGYDLEKRLFHRLGKRYIEAYKYEIEGLNNYAPDKYLTMELWYRIHLIIDHVSGMTDEYALETYQMLEGINLLKV